MTQEQASAIEYALAQLRMAYDLRQIGDSQAQFCERYARSTLAEVLGVPYDSLRQESKT